MSSAARIRHADPKLDAAACAAIYEPYVRGTAISFEDEPPDAAEMRRRIETVSARYPWLVADRDGRAVGYAYGTTHRPRAAYRWTAEVAIYIDPGHRGHGIGRALYEALLGLLAGQGMRMACAGITLPNEASVALHDKLGFQPVGIYRQIGFKHGAWHDVGWWQRELSPGEDGAPREPGPPVRLPDG